MEKKIWLEYRDQGNAVFNLKSKLSPDFKTKHQNPCQDKFFKRKS